MAKTMMAKRVADRVVVVHRAEPPSDAEFDGYVAILREHGADLRGQLVYTLGASPSTMQRKRATEATPQRRPTPPTAVMTDSTTVRSVVTAFNWFFDNSFKAFKTTDTRGAALHLGATDDEMASMMACVRLALVDLDDRRAARG